ncbi:MAG: Gldg family protein [Phycisphaeraceae bacterium]|nr:Gldg family protein [Phycisphaeraceae bacterium]
MRGASIISVGAFVAALVAFIAVNVLAGSGLTRARIDLTEGRLYTLSAGSRAIAANVPEPVRLTLYLSEGRADIPPQIATYAQRVREVLAEYARASGGRVVVEVVNPEPFSDAEDRAVAAGLAGIPTGRGQERIYFGLVGTNTVDRQEVVPFLRPEREPFLEYELTRMIYLLGEPERRAIGLMSWLPVDGGPPNPMTGQPGAPALQVVRQAREMFDIRAIERDATQIPTDIQVLWIVHPKGVGEPTQYAIDQFVMRGGRVLLFVDPLCDADVPPGVNPMQAMNLPKNSDLPRLLQRWGVELVPSMISTDRDAALRVNVGGQGRPEPVDYIAWMNLAESNIDRADAVTGGLRSLIVPTAGALRAVPGATTDLAPLAQTGPNSALIAVEKFSFFPDPKALLAEFKPRGERLTIAARVTGPAHSAFDDPPEGVNSAAHLQQSAGPINLIIFADCDMLQDRFWVQEERIGPIVLGLNKMADNGDFVIAALDNLTGSSDLMAVRARGTFRRPFDRVDRLRREAEQRYQSREQELQARLRETEQKINELQRARPDSQNPGGMVLLTPEQQAEIEKFRAEQVATRQDLRAVQHQLVKDIEGLGRSIKFINIGLMPILVGVAALALGAWRARRRRADRTHRAALN